MSCDSNCFAYGSAGFLVGAWTGVILATYCSCESWALLVAVLPISHIVGVDMVHTVNDHINVLMMVEFVQARTRINAVSLSYYSQVFDDSASHRKQSHLKSHHIHIHTQSCPATPVSEPSQAYFRRTRTAYASRRYPAMIPTMMPIHVPSSPVSILNSLSTSVPRNLPSELRSLG